jgi:hypothetical protein
MPEILDNTYLAPMYVLPGKDKGETYMIDPEVARLRRLRSSALRVRAIARALGSTRFAVHDSLFARGACSSWRIARVVSGRLKAHPYLHFQKREGVLGLMRNSVLAGFAALFARSRRQALLVYESQLRQLVRQLDDARALTWSTELSDTFGRSQVEIRALMTALTHETKSPIEPARTASRVGSLAPPIASDWPYLAF